MAPWRRSCVFGCEDGTTLFGLPKEEALRQAWIEFVYGNQHCEQDQNIKFMFLCSRHFTEDCILNRSIVESGFGARLMLVPGSVPTMRGKADVVEEKPKLTSEIVCNRTSRTVACQTESRITHAVGTQLSLKTLQNHVRSTATQVGPSKVSKRPFDEDEEKEEDSVEDPLSKKTKQSDNGSVVSAVTEKIPSKSPTHVCNAANFIVYEDCLLELFNVCPKCEEPSDVRASRHGSILSVLQECPQCHYSRMWNSQPKV